MPSITSSTRRGASRTPLAPLLAGATPLPAACEGHGDGAPESSMRFDGSASMQPPFGLEVPGDTVRPPLENPHLGENPDRFAAPPFDDDPAPRSDAGAAVDPPCVVR